MVEQTGLGWLKVQLGFEGVLGTAKDQWRNPGLEDLRQACIAKAALSDLPLAWRSNGQGSNPH
jgi:hypothetical protein